MILGCGASGPLLEGTARVADGVETPAEKGTLVVGWLRPDEAARWRKGEISLTLLVELVQRFVPVQAVRLPATFEVPYPGGPAVPIAFFDSQHKFWESMFGSGVPGNLVGFGPAAGKDPKAGAVSDVVMKTGPKPRKRPENCEGERLELFAIDAPDVVGRMGNDPKRKVCVFLPRSYATQPARRYPVIYALPGLGGNHSSSFRKGRGIHTILDELSRRSGREAILVGVDTSTKLGSSYLVDSPHTGAYRRFLAEAVPATIDARYRTIAKPTARGLFGQSTGGFNAVAFAMRESGVFTAAGASAPDGLDLEDWLVDAEGRVRPLWLKWTRLEDAVGGWGQMVSYASDWSPGAERGFLWPYDLDDGEVDRDLLAGWLKYSPMHMLERPEILEAVRTRLNGRIFIAVGRDDEFKLFEPAVKFSKRLKELGVEHGFVAAPGGHFKGIMERFVGALGHLLKVLDPSA